MEDIQYDIALVCVVNIVFTIQLANTLVIVSSQYHYFGLLFYSIGVALLILITFRNKETDEGLDDKEKITNPDSVELKSKRLLE